MKSAKGFIFDFNGTLIFDRNENKEAWNLTALHYRGIGLSEEEFQLNNGRLNSESCKYILQDRATPELIKECELFKENCYKSLCLKNKLELVNGAKEFIIALKKEGKILSIASSAPMINRNWYIPYFNLLSYFDDDMIIMGREDIQSKPQPDIFLYAARQMKMDISDCIIFEDSKMGLIAAKNAGAMAVIKIDSDSNQFDDVDLIIKDFTDERLKELI